MATISLPHNFTPRPYQLPVLRALDNGATRVVAVWHRRSGKEKTFLNYTAKSAFNRVGTYFYLFPTYKQAKKAIWDGMDRSGFPFLGHFPREIVRKRNEQELKLELVNGSIFQLIGSDNIDSVMSTNPVGCVFAEYSLQDPVAWDYMRPILRENGGWAIFDYTPRGKNHGFKLFELAKQLQAERDPHWFCERLTIDDTGALTKADINQERREGMSDDMIQQEFYCSFEGVQQGSIFGKQMEQAERDGRICGVPWQPELPVDTWWDIGSGDPTAIWFTQSAGREVHVIDYYENSGVGVGIDHYIDELRKKPYRYGCHTGPHDLNAHQFAAGGKSSFEIAKAFGFKFEVLERSDKQEGIQISRAFISRCWFDEKKTERGRLALASYHYQWIESRKVFSTEPYHDWSSNAADAWRYLAVGYRDSKPRAAQSSRNTQTVGSGANGWMVA